MHLLYSESQFSAAEVDVQGDVRRECLHTPLTAHNNSLDRLWVLCKRYVPLATGETTIQSASRDATMQQQRLH